MMMRLACWLSIVCLAMVARPAAAAETASGEAIGYNRDIRPILAENCFACHGPDSAARKADLRLDQRDAAIEMGAIAPGKPGESELVARITADDPETQMPPASTHKKLTSAQKQLLARWIESGAEYQPHWSFIAPVRPGIPAVQNKSWPRNPIDEFILARLESAGLQPAAEADRRTLARRVTLDLTGLPPEPEDVEAFVNDTAPDAYERLVEGLLTSSRWGEHRARYWLDLARYADTNGIHFDNFREMWSYREWVIKAFNRNTPFDQFTIEQLGGDLLPDRSLEQLVASGFNRCNMTTNEGGIIDEEYLVLYTRDRTETTSLVWLGMTAGCAVCHDHKFDPLSQREFYEMAAFFNNTTQDAKDGNIHNTPPVVVVPYVQDREAWQALPAQLAAAQQKIDARRAEARGDYDAWLAQATPSAIRAPVDNQALVLHAPLGECTNNVLTLAVGGEVQNVALAATPAYDEAGVTSAKAFKASSDTAVALPGAGDFEKDQAFTCTAWVKVPPGDLSGAIVARMDEGSAHRGWDLWLDDGRPATHIVHAWPGDAVKVIGKRKLEPNTWYYVTIAYDGSGSAGGVKIYLDGQAQEVEVAADTLKNSIRTGVPFQLAQRSAGGRVDGLSLQDLRIYARVLAPDEINALASVTRAAYLVGKPAEGRSSEEAEELYRWWLDKVDPVYDQLGAAQRELKSQEAAIQARSSVAHVMQEKSDAAMAYILFRGEYDKRRDEVKPDTPDILPPFPDDLPRTRLGFARWLLRPDHPLTARVAVNRFWQEVFGNGIVKTSGDLGVAGELPSHPELLDWLAVEFRETGWDVKRMFRLMVLSAAYRQSSAVTPDKLEKDADNRLFSRGPRYRMDAEMVRDYALAASGLLVEKLGGQSVKPYQPDGVWEAVAMIGSNTRDYKPDSGENLYRRSMYTFWKRAAPPASMEIFNAPNREICAVRRERTNTPLQALVTLNDPQFVEAARHLAERTLREGGDSDAARADFIAGRLLARPLADEERAVVERTLAELLDYYRAHTDDAKKLVATGQSQADPALDVVTLAGWTMLANQMLNLDEALNK
jgi:mono/diheme cytochrome c family protein